MKEIKNKLIVRLLIGFVAGMIIGAFIMTGLNELKFLTAGGKMFLINLIGSGIYGAVAIGGTISYEIEDWGLTKATLTHYLITFTAFLTANHFLHWFGNGGLLIAAIIAFTVIYALIWLMEYTIWKRSIEDLNRELSEMKDRKINENYIIKGDSIMADNNMEIREEEMVEATGGKGNAGGTNFPTITGIVFVDPFPTGIMYRGVFEDCQKDGLRVFELSDGIYGVAGADIPDIGVGDQVTVSRIRGYYGWQITGVIDY